MLSYRHGFHAGNFADVVKHVVLVALMNYLHRKEKPCYIQDTHAGRGMYTLDSEEALHGREFDDGIGRLWGCETAPSAVQSYLEIVSSFNRDGTLRYYPGSPAIIQAMLRPGERLLLTELHPAEHQQLLSQFRDNRQVQVHRQDAYQGLKAFLPPAERRGLVLIDPPYERKDEYERVVEGLKTAYAKWPQAVYAIWYPVMSEQLQAKFINACKATGIRKMLHIAFTTEPVLKSALQFSGCGLVLVNPPWQLQEEITEVLGWLAEQLQMEYPAEYSVEWIVPE